MRGSYNGNTLAFQAKAESSILLPRSKEFVLKFVCPGGEMVDTRDLKSLASRRAGSSPAPGTKYYAQVVEWYTRWS